MTLFTLVTRKKLLIYALCTLFTGIFTIIYIQFSHGVYSLFMNTLCVYSLIGLVIFIGLKLSKKRYHKFGFFCIDTSILLLTLGNLLKGIFDIANTESPYVSYYFYTGILLALIGILVTVFIKSKSVIAS